MYVANTHLKPVIGLDIHFVNLPFPFVPLPHPYIGLVIDPFDYLPVIGATVKVNHVPRGNTDTAGMLITFIHIPFGAGFTLIPLIGHDSSNFFGSKTVQVDGAPMSGAGYVLMTCNDIGLPLSFQPGKKFKPIPSLYLPTSFCIPMQWGKPVMVGGPMVPHFSLMALLKAFAFGSFLKIFGKAGGKLLNKLKSKVGKSGLSEKLQSLKCRLGRDPVDLITGRVTYEYTDFELPGAIPIQWNRTWDSDASIKGPAGHGVQLSYDRYIKLWPEEECLSLVLADGRFAVFPILFHGESFYHPQEKMLLRRKQNGHFLLEDYNDSLYYHFNHDVEPGTWRLSFIENYSGHRIQLHYTGRHLKAITDCVGRQLFFTLDSQYRITQVTVKHRDVEQILVTYHYNEEGDLISIADALNQVATIEYHDHLMIKQTDRDGQSFYWEYDEKRRCTHTWGDGGIWEGFIEYRKGYNIVTNSLGETTTYYYDENNLCIQETDHYGNHKYTEYTEDFEIYREIDEEGNITGYTYDEKGLVKEKTWPDGSSVRYVYNEHNQPTIINYPNGSSQTFGYDDSRRLRFINYPGGKILTYEYNEEGQLIMIIEGNNDQTKLSYDEDNNLASLQLPDGSIARWKYDPLGRCVQTANTKDQVRHFEYDRLSRICNMHLPDGNTVRLTYNAYEEIVQAADRHNNVQFEYTPLGNLKKRIQHNAEVQFIYDTEERLNAVINEAGSHYTFSYNKRGEIIQETGFDGLQQQFERDATGKVIKTHRPGGHYTQYEYDANGRIIRVEYHDGSWELYNYDKNGNLKEAANEHSTVRFIRNKMGHIETEEQDGYLVHSRYDKTGARIQITSNLGADIQLHRNNLGQVTNMQAKVNDLLWEAQMKYNQAGQEIERLLPGGLTSAWQYDHAGRPGEHKVSSRGVVQSWKKYTWDVNNRLNNVFDAISQANTHFKYDALGNLAFVQYANNSIIHRTTDDTGNIYESVTKTDRKYNSAGALLESEKYIFKYDDEGNLVSKTNRTSQKKTYYEWLANGMLKKVVRPDGKAVEFKYDALNRRIAKCFDGKVTRWVWDGNVPLHEWSYHEKDKPKPAVNEWGKIIYDKQEPNPQNAPAEVGAITWIFEAGNSVPAAKIENGEQYSIISDHLGTPQCMYDSAGKKVWEGVLDIYGRIRTLSGNKSSLPFRYQGQYEDVETGLYYNRYRYYTPEEGMYISQDPIGLNGGNPTLYGYVKDPNVWTDVFGLRCKRTKTFKKQQKICDRFVGTLTGKKPDEVEALLTKKGYTKSHPQAATPAKIQHTVFTRKTGAGDTYILDYHPGGKPGQENIHGNDYWKIYKVENGEKEVYGRIGHDGFKNYGDIQQPVYIDGVLVN
jgi:RHS repeat-associated protein